MRIIKNGFPPNKNSLQFVPMGVFDRLFAKHMKDGFIVITDNRGQEACAAGQCLDDFSELKKNVRSNGFGFIPVYAEYTSTDAPEQTSRYRPFLLIPNRMAASSKAYPDDIKLLKYGVTLANINKLTFFLYKPMNDYSSAYYINPNGATERTFTNESADNLIRHYCSDTMRIFCSTSSESRCTVNPMMNRFVYNHNLFIPRSPVDMQEAIKRYGEEFFNLK